MIAAAILSIAVIGLVGAFGGIQRALQASKGKSLASNLAQEKMQIIKQKSYYQVLITTDPAYNTDYTPNIPYDSGYFPPESILEGTIRFQRLTYVEVVREDSGVLVSLPATSPDTGMKRITVSVTWRQGNDLKKLEIRSVLANPDTVMSNSIFTGTILNASTLLPISGALVNLAENTGWRDTTNAAGAYSINLSPGSGNMQVSAPGYFSALKPVSIAAQESLTENFSLVPMASGTVQGTAWINPHLVISQVVVETNTWVAGGAFQSVEYIELFNPTPNPINIGTTGDPQVRIDYDSEAAGLDHSHADFNFVFITTYVPSGKYYLIANATAFMILGSAVNADACFGAAANCDTAPTYVNYFDNNRAGDLRLRRFSDNTVYDIVGWKDGEAGSDMPDYDEGSPIPNYTAGGLDGIEAGNQIVRASSPAYTSDTYGKAYDSDNNIDDFIYPSASFIGIQYPPRNTSIAAQTVIAGVPADGAVVSCVDSLSAPTTAYRTASPARAVFTLPQVATGTWTVYISSGNFMLQNDTVTIAATGSVYTFPSSTTLLTQENTAGFISGIVTDALGVAISPSITVDSGGAGLASNASTVNGRYILKVTTGLVDVNANPSNTNPNYVSHSSQAIRVNLGEVHSGVNFLLSQGGRITGFVTRDGTNALPGVAVAALDVNGYAQGQQVSGTDGRFTTLTIATGTYSVEPVLGSKELSVPASVSVTVAIGGTVSAGTFTITGAMGSIRGTVTSGGQAITTGVMIIVTTSTLAGSPPAPPTLSVAALTASPYYITSSYEDGTYSVEVRQSTSPVYRVYSYYTTVSASGVVTINSQTNTSVSVLAGQIVTGVNFAW